MAITEQQKRFIDDNPNLSSAAIGRFLGLSRHVVNKNRSAPVWRHDGVGLPFVATYNTENGIYRQVKYKGDVIRKGSDKSLIPNVDRLIWALEHGGVPPRMSEAIFLDLEFKKVK